MTPEQYAALRKPFLPAEIGKLPKPYKSDSAKGNCQECGSYHGLPAVHLDFAGHAAVTDRLLAVDPDWTWEPFATDEHGLPAYQSGALWIRLTVCGVTRIGVGDGPDPKQRIGDSIRNAAMRFGVGLDLWTKQELSGVDPNGGDPTARATTPEAFRAKHPDTPVVAEASPPPVATVQAAAQPIESSSSPDAPDVAALHAEQIVGIRDAVKELLDTNDKATASVGITRIRLAASKDKILMDPCRLPNGDLVTLDVFLDEMSKRALKLRSTP